MLQIISDTIPLYDAICKHSLLFVKRCLCSDCAVVKHVARYEVYHDRKYPVSKYPRCQCSVMYWALWCYNGCFARKIVVLVRLSTIYEKERSLMNIIDALWLLWNC